MRFNFGRIVPNVAVGAVCLGLMLSFIGNGSAINFADNYIFYLAAMVLALLGIVLKGKLSVEDPFIYVFFMAFLAVTLLVGGLSSHTDPGTFKTMVMASAFILLMLFLKCEDCHVRKIESGIIIGSVIFSVLILFFGNHYLSEGTGKYTYIQTFGNEVVFEPNFTAFFITVGFEMAAVRFMQGLVQRKKAFYVIAMLLVAGVQMLAMFRTGSRLSLVAAIIFVGAYVLFTKNVKLRKYALSAVVLASILLIIAVIFGLIPESIVTRLFQTSYLDGSNMKRISDWYYGAMAMLRTPFGFGPTITSEIIGELFSFSGDAHNTFINVGIFYGPLAFLSFLALWGYVLAKLIQYKDDAYAAMLVSVFFQANIMPLQNTVMLWIFMLLMIVRVCIRKREALTQNTVTEKLAR